MSGPRGDERPFEGEKLEWKSDYADETMELTWGKA